MLRFFLIYAAVYGGMNAYLFRNIRRAFELGGIGSPLLGLFLAAMVAAPALVRVFEGRGLTLLARPAALLGYCWMAAALWLFVLFAGRDLWNLAVATFGHFAPSARRFALPLRGSALAFFAAALLAGLWGSHEARQIRLREVTLRLPRLPPGSRPVRILFVSDVHLDVLGGERTLRRVAELAEAAKPDVLLSGGDLVDAPAEHRGTSLELLRALPAPLGKYAITGNHEYYAGIREAERFTEDAGFRLLKGASVLLGERLLLVGVDDPAARQLDSRRTPGEDELLPQGADRPAVLLLKHRPEAERDSLGRFDLQLSGHSHGGQIYPFRYLSRLAYPLPDGLSEVGRGSLLYKGLGTGTWGPPFRLLAPPEVTLFVLAPSR
ncbi:MAG: metallophosphoesterase [Deltaproteobacteria bacterium]|nr:metallophosphoesterase [Deltaproteobacteria bacterium]